MMQPSRVVFCHPSREERLGILKRCLPFLIAPVLLLIVGNALLPPGTRWPLYISALVLALPCFSDALALLKMLWTRREVVIDLRERTITQTFRMPWRARARWCPFHAVLRVTVTLNPSRREWSLSLELVGGNEVPLVVGCGTDDALTLATKAAELLGVRVQGRIV